MTSRRFADLPLMVKLGLAPAFAVVVLALVAGGGFWSQQRQAAAVQRIVDKDMAGSLELARISKRITAAHGRLYALLTNQAGGVEADQIPTKLQALLAEVDGIKAELAKAQRELPADQKAKFDRVLKDLADYRGGIEVVGSMMGVDFTTAAAFVQPFEEHYTRMTTTLDEATRQVEANARAQAQATAANARLTGEIAVGGVLVTLLAVAGISIATIAGMRRAINGLAGATETLAAGDHQIDLEALARGDELGAIVRSLGVFKDNQRRLAAMRQEQEATQAREAAMREEVERERALAEEAQSAVVSSLADGLSRLSQGDLTHRLNAAFAPEYEQLRRDFNGTVEKLQGLVRLISGNVAQIVSGSEEIASAAGDLSRRTEQQAASLEETAAALDQITATVRKTAEGANHARDVVQTAKAGAAEGGEVVRQAITAMGEIESSATQISQIIGVIDEIAFQTNLLALNAGVEAARAGDAGRGFAVVASEVRALAQRSAEAAKEIKTLISASSTQVGQGVDLVGRTGEALQRIVDQVGEINGLVVEIAASAQEQATGLTQVNSAVNQMDQMTQQNAAMVEQSAAATQSLTGDAGELRRLVGEFRTGDAPVQAAPAKPAPKPQPVSRAGAERRPVPSAPRQMRRELATALAAKPAADEWEEF